MIDLREESGAGDPGGVISWSVAARLAILDDAPSGTTEIDGAAVVRLANAAVQAAGRAGRNPPTTAAELRGEEPEAGEPTTAGSGWAPPEWDGPAKPQGPEWGADPDVRPEREERDGQGGAPQRRRWRQPEASEPPDDPETLPDWVAALVDGSSVEMLRWAEGRLILALASTGGGPCATLAKAALEIRGAREARGAATDGVDPELDSDPRRALEELARLGREAETLLREGESPTHQATTLATARTTGDRGAPSEPDDPEADPGADHGSEPSGAEHS